MSKHIQSSNEVLWQPLSDKQAEVVKGGYLGDCCMQIKRYFAAYWPW